jgi:hypothetical protein
MIQALPEKRKAKPTDESKLGFGKIFTDGKPGGKRREKTST